ncbi:Unhealthy ribosome biogenesis protein 2 -like protein [Collichthys lucidus]|uniref:Unhealthy ribosome biogenesis protein 2-like protein n=1 Tax=Collichthys lucidus TaxID=240159 RepID=A0A4V6AP31_COLLU|nr:Unhealthy ribosome biogenesis protein 2 -like protein [Collichthys lucidus]
MAAIYSGIHLKLKSPQTPWEDKLKLARFAWISNQCLLPNKEQVLLDWCTHALTGWYNQKVEFSLNVLEGLWCYLDDLLHSKKLHSLLIQGKTVSLRLNMAQLLLERLQECARVGSKPPVCVSTILSVCQGLLSSPALSSVFTTKYELMVDLLAKICSLACHELQQPLVTDVAVTCQDEMITECLQIQPTKDLDNSQIEPITESPPDSDPEPKKNLRSANLYDVLLQVLSCYLSVQRQQANPNRVFTMVTNQLIQTLVLLRHLLTSGEFAPFHTHLHLRQQLCRDIRVKIDSILQLALLPSEHLVSYKEELLPSKEDSGKRGPGGAKGPLKPVSAILSKLSAPGYCEPALFYTVKSNTLSLLFKFFQESYGKGRGESEEAHKMLCFYFLTRLVPALDLSLDGHSPAKAEKPVSVSPGQKSPPASLSSPESWSLALLAVESLLSQALSADIYNVAADRIRHGEVQLNFYRALGQMLFNQAQPSIPAWYRCLKVLLSLNHLILEPDLDQLLSSAWLMVCSLLQIYTKLRQLPRLFSELLSVICQPVLDHVRPPLLSEGISASLRTCLLDTPPSQGVEICSLVLESIRKYVLPDLVKEEGGSEKMETDGGGDDKGIKKEIKVDQEREDASLKLSSLSQLLHAILFSLKTLDNTSPLPIVRQSQGLMQEMQQVLKELLHVLSSNKKAAVKSNTSSVQKTPKKGKKNLDHKEVQKVSESKMGALWEQKTQEAALLLKYTWVEVDTLFYIHCSKYTSLDLVQTAAVSETEGRAPVLTDIESYLAEGNVIAGLQPSCSLVSCLLLKLLTLQQTKKILLDTPLLSEPSVLVNKAAQFILAKSECEVSLNGEQMWDGQIGSVNANSYLVAHWYLVTSNLPLIAPYLSSEDVCCVADALVSSLLSRQTDGGKDRPPGYLTISLISSQLLQSPVLAELPSLFSATVRSLTQRIVGVLKAAHVHKACPTLLKFQEKGIGAKSLKSNASQPLPTLVDMETIVEDILSSSKTGEVSVLLTDAQSKELVNLLQILTDLNPDGMNSEDLSSMFLLLLFMLTSTSCQSDQMAMNLPESGDGVVFLVKLLRILTCLLEGKNFQSVLKLIHGGTVLQAVVSSLLWHSNNGRFRATRSPDWLDLVKTLQGFIRCTVQLIIIRNSSVRLNLDQFASYLTSTEIANREIMAPSSATVSAKADPQASILSVHLLLASLTSFSQAMTSNLGKSKPMDQTLTQMLTRTTASLGPAVESVLKPRTVSKSFLQPASVLGQAFVVEVVTVMLHCELSSLSVEEANKQKNTQITLSHMSLYQSICQQILKEISSAHRPMDFLVSSFHFLSAFYKAVSKVAGEREEEQGEEKKELDELYMQILQNIHRLLTASWLSPDDVCELEPAVHELLRHLVEKGTTGQFNLLLVMIREGLDTGQLRAGNYRFLVRSSSQDVSLTLPFTVPTVTSMTSLLRQGEGRITNPHHVILVLGALQSVPLDHLTPHVYQSAFLAVHEALFAIIQCHPQVTLRPDIKLHLTEGIYQILDLCMEQDIKFLTAGLQMGVREVFNELYGSYTHYHKAQRQGEDKYTV